MHTNNISKFLIILSRTAFERQILPNVEVYYFDTEKYKYFQGILKLEHDKIELLGHSLKNRLTRTQKLINFRDNNEFVHEAMILYS